MAVNKVRPGRWSVNKRVRLVMRVQCVHHLCGGSIGKHIALDGYWAKVVERFTDSNWWNSPEPQEALEKQIWKCRAAFLDVRFYQPDWQCDRTDLPNFFKVTLQWQLSSSVLKAISGSPPYLEKSSSIHNQINMMFTSLDFQNMGIFRLLAKEKN